MSGSPGEENRETHCRYCKAKLPKSKYWYCTSACSWRYRKNVKNPIAVYN